jgi:hypothetical protein
VRLETAWTALLPLCTNRHRQEVVPMPGHSNSVLERIKPPASNWLLAPDAHSNNHCAPIIGCPPIAALVSDTGWCRRIAVNPEGDPAGSRRRRQV